MTAATALLLLALAGGFLFAYICEYTRYPSLRGEGQQLYFIAAVCAIGLLFASRIILATVARFAPDNWREGFRGFLDALAGPFYSNTLPTFFLAFVLGPALAWLINRWTDRNSISDRVIDTYGQELEKFLYRSARQKRLLYITLENRKVYVGWAIDMPPPKPRRDAPKDHFTILPAKSGYLAESDLKADFTTFYGPAYEQIADEKMKALSLADFQVIIPLDQMVVVRPYSLDVDPRLFEASQEQPEEGSRSGLLSALLLLLASWLVTRRQTED